MKHIAWKQIVLVSLSAGLLGCGVTDGEEEDPIDESFLVGGKADGITEGSADALGVLQTANTLSKSDLLAKVSLAPLAANNIIAYRAGTDGQLGTGDDRTFTSLAQLDALPYVGMATFVKLLDYSKHHAPPTPPSGYSDSSPEAQAVFRFLNTVGLEALQYIVGDGGNSWYYTRDNVARCRAEGGFNTVGWGTCGLAGTVGNVDYWLDWVKAVGYLPSSNVGDPFDAGSCSGPKLAGSALTAYLGAGQSEAAFGSYQIYVRTRTCNGLNTCGPWQEVDDAAMEGTARLRLEGTRLMLVLLDQGDCIDPQYGLRSFASRSQTADGAWSNGDLLALPAYQYYDASCNQTSLKVSGPNSQLVRFLGTVTADCFRFTSKIMRIPATQTAPARDVQYVVLGAH